MGLDNVRVVSGRVEAVSDVRADVVTSRAFAELADFVSWTAHLLKDGGYWAAMKGVYPQGKSTACRRMCASKKSKGSTCRAWMRNAISSS